MISIFGENSFEKSSEMRSQKEPTGKRSSIFIENPRQYLVVGEGEQVTDV